MITRRRFIKTTGIVAASAAVMGLAQAAPARVRLTRHRVRWPSGVPLRVVHLTDLHVGWGTPKRILEQSVRLCHQAKPDLVVLTGDYLNHSLVQLPALSRMLQRLPRPCVATLGNHDHWSGAGAIERVFSQHGVPVLRNEHMRVGIGSHEVSIVGIDDGFTKHHDVKRAFGGLSHPETALVLSHFPETAKEIAAHGGRVVLSGHTHGGQVHIPKVTQAIARMAGSTYLSGWYDVEGAHLYVNAGLGSSAVRLRVGQSARPEVAILDFV